MMKFGSGTKIHSWVKDVAINVIWFISTKQLATPLPLPIKLILRQIVTISRLSFTFTFYCLVNQNQIQICQSHNKPMVAIIGFATFVLYAKISHERLVRHLLATTCSHHSRCHAQHCLRKKNLPWIVNPTAHIGIVDLLTGMMHLHGLMVKYHVLMAHTSHCQQTNASCSLRVRSKMIWPLKVPTLVPLKYHLALNLYSTMLIWICVLVTLLSMVISKWDRQRVVFTRKSRLLLTIKLKIWVKALVERVWVLLALLIFLVSFSTILGHVLLPLHNSVMIVSCSKKMSTGKLVNKCLS
mmetsp:Transcript_5149/g.7800  ORF Transcript_5149/g.7800 Transcript_5149/m.7800 type:complete len:297 (-) Transcript_5149:131-1021(-)